MSKGQIKIKTSTSLLAHLARYAVSHLARRRQKPVVERIASARVTTAYREIFRMDYTTTTTILTATTISTTIKTTISTTTISTTTITTTKGHLKKSVSPTRAPRELGFFALYSEAQNMIFYNGKRSTFLPILQWFFWQKKIQHDFKNFYPCSRIGNILKNTRIYKNISKEYYENHQDMAEFSNWNCRYRQSF